MLDAVSIGKLPVLSLKTPVGILPFIEEAGASINTVEKLIEQALELLSDPRQSAELYEQLRASVSRLTRAEIFQEKLHEAYAIAHGVKKDDSRFATPLDGISKFDIISNELCIIRKQP